MKITFLGGADEVGASCTLVEIAGKRLLIDAGIRISPKTSRGIQNDQLPDLHPISVAGGPDYILVTHAHTDHTAALPLVMEQYPHVPVIMTRPTEALVRVLQKDAQNIMKSRQEVEGELPLFDEIAVNRLLEAVQMIEFNQAIKLGEDLQVTYYVAGHIAGAAMLVLESTEGTLVISGDVSVSDQRTVKSVQVPRIKADALVLESTYGGKLHANRVAEEKRLVQTLQRVTERGGKVLIPAFALGRSQELIQIIHAFSDQINVPVYVDGMVRSVCDAYARFADLLPTKTVKAAGDEHLFFRGHVKPIKSAEMRSNIAFENTPCVIVASSGMLTGGASMFYAKHFANDERNAILLTGYQDEESPGRFLQQVMRSKETGEAPTLKLGNDLVKVRCEIDTYSLSAHADESELISLAEALSPQEIMLVHGDEAPRHSLASGLRQRGRIVTTPRIGTERVFNFQQKPWAVGSKLKQGSHQGSIDLNQLWTSIKDQAGSFFSARELAQVWWGDGERANEMASRLNMTDNIFFAPDWRNKSTFLIHTEAQVNRVRLQHQIMLSYPDLVGKLIVLRNSNGQPRIGIVQRAQIDGFSADVQNAKGSQYPADALVWVIGDGKELPEGEGGIKSRLSDLIKNARAFADALLPYPQRKAIVDSGQPVNPSNLMPASLPEGIDPITVLTSIVLALATDGAVWTPDGLRLERARAQEPLEQNEARELALAIFPTEARLRKVGMEIHRRWLTLFFDFPSAAERLYADIIEDLIEQSGWEVKVKPQVNQQALAIALEELLPQGAYISKGPSYYMDRSELHVEIAGLEDLSEIEEQFLNVTNFKLVTARQKTVDVPIVTVDTGSRLEINQAYAVVKQALEPLGLYKAGLKQNNIVLSFISPQLAERHQAVIQRIATETGYGMQVHPHPNQQKILEIVQRVAREAGWQISKGPSIFTDKGTVAIALYHQPSPNDWDAVCQRVEDTTGYQLTHL